jgi:phosphohistidine phosphatase SixA
VEDNGGIESSEAVVARLRELGVAKLVFVRHASSDGMAANAAKRSEAPHDWKRDDQQRCLTKKGLGQCEAATAAWFGATGVTACLTSPARRASETAMRMLSNYETEETKKECTYLRMVESAHPGK